MVAEFSFFKKMILATAFEHDFGPRSMSLKELIFKCSNTCKEEVEVSNWSSHKHEICLMTYTNPQ